MTIEKKLGFELIRLKEERVHGSHPCSHGRGMDLFLDASFIIPLIIESDTTEKARDYFSPVPGACAASMSVYEETFFVGLRLIAEDELGITRTAGLKDHIRENGYGIADILPPSPLVA